MFKFLDITYLFHSSPIPLNVQWNRKYYSCGDFSIQLNASDYDDSMKYVMCDDYPEVGIINQVNYENKETGEYVLLSGYFLEFKLYDKIVYPRFNQSGNITNIARNLFNGYKSDIDIECGLFENLGTTTTLQESNDELAKRLYALLQSQELSFRVKFDYVNNNRFFEVWQGIDRTQDNIQGNNWVTFSSEFGNVKNEVITIDDSNYKNYAIVVGNGAYEDGNQITEIVDLSNGGYQKQVYVDATSSTYDSEEQTLQEFKDSLYQIGLENLLEKNMIQNITFDLIQGDEFDLGDKVTYYNAYLKKTYETRIIELSYIYKNNDKEVKITIGDLMPKH